MNETHEGHLDNYKDDLFLGPYRIVRFEPAGLQPPISRNTAKSVRMIDIFYPSRFALAPQ